MSLLIADQIFAASAKRVIMIHRVADSELKRLSCAIRLVERAAADAGMSEFVNPRLRPLKAARFALVATPLPGGDQSLRLKSVAERALVDLRSLQMSAGDARIPEYFGAAVGIISQQAELQENLLGVEFLRIWEEAPRKNERVAIIVREPRYEGAVVQWIRGFESMKDVCVLGPAALRGLEYFDVIFIFGAPRWFANDGLSFMFDAPRANTVHIIGFDWTGLSIAHAPVFAGGQPARNDSSPPPDPAPNPRGDSLVDDDPAADLGLGQTIDLERLLRERRNSEPPGDQADEERVARLAILAGGMAVLLEWEDDAITYCIDFSGSPDATDDDTSLVCRRHNPELEDSDFIILRTGGGGDLVPVVGDKILGVTAAGFRARQKKWKKKLSSLISLNGYDDTCFQLKLRGATHASPSNLRTWARERTIRPHADEDFRAILVLCELDGELDAIFLAAKAIAGAHHSAGFEIRRMLIAKMKRTNRSRLKLEGKQEFHLEGLDGEASMTAYRIERIQPNEVRVPSRATGYPFAVEDDLWQ